VLKLVISEPKLANRRRHIKRALCSISVPNSTPKYEQQASRVGRFGCTTRERPARKITREEHEDARQIARDIAKTEQYDISMKLRKKVEMLFAHLKRILGLGRLRLRGPCGANDEFLLAATAQNLRKLAKIFPAPQHTCPA